MIYLPQQIIIIFFGFKNISSCVMISQEQSFQYSLYKLTFRADKSSESESIFLTWSDLPAQPSGHRWKVLLTGINRIFSKSLRVTLNKVALQPRLSATCCVTQGFWFYKQKSQGVSWHCTFKSKKIKSHKRIWLHSDLSYAGPLAALPCENVYGAPHSLQPAHNLIKMPFNATLPVWGF